MTQGSCRVLFNIQRRREIQEQQRSLQFDCSELFSQQL